MGCKKNVERGAKEVAHVVEDVGAAAVGNAFGGPLGAAAAEGLTQKAQGASNSAALIGAVEGGAGAGIGDLASGASLLGGGFEGVSNLATGAYDSVTGLFDSSAPGATAGGTAGGTDAFSATNAGGTATAATPTSAAGSTGATVGASNVGSVAGTQIGDVTGEGGIAGESTGAGTSLGSVSPTDSLVNSFAQEQQPSTLDSLKSSIFGSPAAAAPSDIPSASLTAADNAATPGGAGALNLGNSATSAIGGNSTGGILSSLPKGAAGAIVPAGMLAYEAIKGPPKLPSESQALGLNGAITAPLLATEQQNLNEANTGQLTAPQQAQVTQFVQGQQNQLIQQLASEGVTNLQGDSRYISGMANIQQQAIALQQQFIAAALQAGTAAAGAAGQNVSQVANQQLQQDQDFQNSLSNAVGSIGSILGGVSTTKAA